MPRRPHLLLLPPPLPSNHLRLQQALAQTLEEDNARLSKRAAELEDSSAAAPADGTSGSGVEGQGQEDGWEVVGEGEHDRARLEEVRMFTTLPASSSSS